MQDYNKRKNDLLHEKIRNNLPLEITEEEISKLKNNWPIQKIIGFVEMQNIKIFVNKKVLIPRYETEEVVLEAYKFINKETKVLDLCCGSGFIGLAIKKNTNAKKVVLSDIDKEALEQSYENAKFNNLEVEIIESDLFSNINETFDVIISNPPYLPYGEKIEKSVLNFEPHHALFADNYGNWFYEKILQESKQRLNNNGVIIFEISPHQLTFFKNKKCTILLDINKKERIVIIKKENI